MIPAGVLAGRLSLVAKERKSVDFPVEIPAANFCYFFLNHSHIAVTLNLYHTGIFLCCLMLQKQRRMRNCPVLEREGFCTEFGRVAGLRVQGGCSAALGKKSPPAAASINDPGSAA